MSAGFPAKAGVEAAQGGCPRDTPMAVPPGAGVSPGVPAALSSLGHGPSQGVGVPNAARNAEMLFMESLTGLGWKGP